MAGKVHDINTMPCRLWLRLPRTEHSCGMQSILCPRLVAKSPPNRSALLLGKADLFKTDDSASQCTTLLHAPCIPTTELEIPASSAPGRI